MSKRQREIVYVSRIVLPLLLCVVLSCVDSRDDDLSSDGRVETVHETGSSSEPVTADEALERGFVVRDDRLEAIGALGGLNASLDDDGLSVRPAGGLDWASRFALRTIGRGALTSAPEQVAPVLGDCDDLGFQAADDGCPRPAEFRRGTVTEFYRYRPNGLEHGFYIATRPDGAGPLSIEMTVVGLEPRLAENGEVVDLLDDEQVVLHYGALYAFGADRLDLPAHIEVAEGTIRLVIDDRGARYPVTVDPIFHTPNWAWDANINNAQLGDNPPTGGDVNNDGYDDLVIGSNLYDYSNNGGAGNLFVNRGTANGIGSRLAHREGSSSERLGFAVAVGNFNKDAYEDVLVGSNNRARIYFGSSGGIGSSSGWTATPGQDGANFGHDVAACDVNGDGYDDIVIGADRYDAPNSSGATLQGQVFVYHGRSGTPPTSPNWTYTQADSSGAMIGLQVACAGDVNKDNREDVIVGTKYLSDGTVFVFHGSSSGLGASPARTLDRVSRFGASIDGAGDVNNDGYDDIIVGMPNASGPTNQGRVEVYYGSASGIGSTWSWTWSSGSTGAVAGSAVAGAGDVNGDGYDDVLVGGPGYHTTYHWGRAWLFLGSASGLQAGPIWYVDGWRYNHQLGTSVGSVGDVNNDGYDDWAVGASMYGSGGHTQEGRIEVYFGGEPCYSNAVCADDNPCTIDTCLGNLLCNHNNVTSGSCDDGNACTTASECQNTAYLTYTCEPTAYLDCNDGDVCTDDSCDATLGCQYEDNTAPCTADDNECTDDVCSEGECTHPPNTATCTDDGDVCTDDVCAEGACTHPFNTAPCNADGNGCTFDDVCSEGACTSGSEPDCDDAVGDECNTGYCHSTGDNTYECRQSSAPHDDQPCTDDGNICTDDVCAGGSCTHPNNTEPCNADSNGCSFNDVCSGGTCTAGAEPDCDTLVGDECNTGYCHSTSDNSYECRQNPAPHEGLSCTDDDDVCTDDVCASGSCTHPHNTAPCPDDGNVCTNDVCAGGSCTHPNNTAPCNADNDGCTFDDVCSGGTCTAGDEPDCDDEVGDECNTGYCESTGDNTYDCLKDPEPHEDEDCTDDDNICTDDVCSEGECTHPNNTAPCPDDGDVCTDDVCSDGECTHPDNTAPCNADNDGCTVNDVCSGGTCVAGYPPVCDDEVGDQCNAGVCQSTGDNTYECYKDPAYRHLWPCNADSDPCTVDDYCDYGTCVAGYPPDCDSEVGDQCNSGVCEPEGWFGYKCVKNPAPHNDDLCNADSDGCTEDDTCVEGTCVAGDPPDCDTEVGDQCNAGVCHSTGDNAHDCAQDPSGHVDDDCSDGDSCTDDDQCSADGNCVGTPRDCSDGNACNGSESCVDGACVDGDALDCDDLEPCTADDCDPSTGCDHNPVADDTVCADDDVCDGEEICTDGTCEAPFPLVCDDGNPCTAETCDPVTGCAMEQVENGVACDTDTICGGVCTDGVCTGGTSTDCDDDDPCTIDRCNDDGTGCVDALEPDGAPCDDGDACVDHSVCLDGTCTAVELIDCDDSDACTDDDCDSVTGCINAPIEGCGVTEAHPDWAPDAGDDDSGSGDDRTDDLTAGDAAGDGGVDPADGANTGDGVSVDRESDGPTNPETGDSVGSVTSADGSSDESAEGCGCDTTLPGSAPTLPLWLALLGWASRRRGQRGRRVTPLQR